MIAKRLGGRVDVYLYFGGWMDDGWTGCVIYTYENMIYEVSGRPIFVAHERQPLLSSGPSTP